MIKLTNLKPTMRSLSTSINGSHDDDRRSSSRTGLEPWQAWYTSRRWRALRLKVLARDAYRCRATGVLCMGTNHAPNSPVVDHIRPHHGNADLFWSIDNLQCVTKEWHDAVKQSRERGNLKGEWY